jgi:tRNA (guanine26-N2/guanine27-N2)-dimethyltransferase
MHADQVLLQESLEHVFQHQIRDCQGKIVMAGPLWIGPLYDRSILDIAKKYLHDYENEFHKRVPKLLRRMNEESLLMNNLYIDIHALCDLHNFIPPKSTDVMNKLIERGFQVSKTHFQPTAIRTTALVKNVADVIVELGGGK